MLLRQVTAKIMAVMGREHFEYVAEGRTWILVLNYLIIIPTTAHI